MSFFSSEYDSLYTHGKNQPIRMCRNNNFLPIGTRDENEKKTQCRFILDCNKKNN